MKDVACVGDEENIEECSSTYLSLPDGKVLTDAVAGVKCSTPIQCDAPTKDGVQCNNGQLRLAGSNLQLANGEGYLEYCYYGTWSSFCSLSIDEAIVACRQLGYEQYNCVCTSINSNFY